MKVIQLWNSMKTIYSTINQPLIKCNVLLKFNLNSKISKNNSENANVKGLQIQVLIELVIDYLTVITSTLKQIPLSLLYSLIIILN